MSQTQLVQVRKGLTMLLHLLAAEQFCSQRRLGISALLYPAVSAEPRPQMGQVTQDALAAYLQVCGLLLRSEVSTNRIAIRVVALLHYYYIRLLP